MILYYRKKLFHIQVVVRSIVDIIMLIEAALNEGTLKGLQTQPVREDCGYTLETPHKHFN